MRMRPLRPARIVIVAALLAFAAPAPLPAAATDLAAQTARYKETQVRLMMRGAQRRAARYAARKPAKGRSARATTAGAGRRPVVRQEPPDPAAAAPLGTAGAQAPASVATNRLVNNRAADVATCGMSPCTGLPWSGQCEVSIVAHGSNVVAAWNDGEGFINPAGTQGYAYSNDGGVTWVDGVEPPTTNVGEWTSDPVLAVNEKNGEFFFSALCDPTASTNGIGVVKGTFVGGVLVWQTPELVISGPNDGTIPSPGAIFDKQWLAVDSTTSNLYLVYSRFTVVNGSITTNRIDIQRKASPLFLWSAATTLSSGTDAGRVQGSRVAVGPEGYVWTTWNAIGSGAQDFMRVRRSTTLGATWGAEVTAVAQYTNFGSGAPGFNRGLGFAFPGLAIDRSSGARRGRAYLAWNESINFFDDGFGVTTVAETEPNDTPATGDLFTLGQNPTGSISGASDLDYWRFNGTQGQTIICEFDGSASAGLEASFRLFCSDGTTRLAFSEPGPGGFGLLVFTLPSTGTYTLRVAPFSGTGSYTIRTTTNGAVTERARDHRDVFTAYSDNSTTWSTPARVNGDAARFDNWLPEVAVSADGNVYCTWYDWRDAPGAVCAGASMTYISRSTDGAATWPDGSPVSSALTPWTTTYSNIAPNQGDYTSLFANQNAVYVCWSDGRNGDPDVFMAAVPLAFTATQVSLAAAHAEPGLVRVTWYAADPGSTEFSVERRTDGEEWSDLGRIAPDGTGRIVHEDRDVAVATRYHYRLALRDGTGVRYAGEVSVTVPSEAALAIADVWPNPADRQLWVSFSLPGPEAATLELIDVSGRRVRDREVTGAGGHTVDLAAGPALKPGLYLIRLTQGGLTAVRRVSVVR